MMRGFMLDNLDWVDTLSKTLRKENKITLEDYIDTATTDGEPLDFLGLVVLCRMYHIHVGVFCSTGVWSTRREKL